MSFAVLDSVSDLRVDNVSRTNYIVRWSMPDGNFDGYVVECNCSEVNQWTCESFVSFLIQPSVLNFSCDELTPGSTYLTQVRTVRVGFDDVAATVSGSTRTSKIL